MTPEQLERKRQQEKQLVTEMIALYCRKQHHTHGQLCPTCQALADYARERSDHCPRMACKTFCSNCPVHCYRPEMRAQIRAVMRFSGPRMLLCHPIPALRHLALSLREKRKLNRRT